MSKAADVQVFVQHRHALTPSIDCWRLARRDGAPLPAFSAGAHVEVQVAAGLRRAYSLCSDPANTAFYEIAVKHEVEGRGGSRALHQSACIGTDLSIGAARNLFALADEPGLHVLVGAGVGLTPLIAMAHSLHRSGKAFQLIARVRQREDLLFAPLLEHGPWSDRVTVSYSSEGALALPGNAAHVYCCGPDGFMQAVKAHYAELPEACWHQEHFAGGALSVAAEQGYRLVLSASGREIEVAAGQRLIDALRANGVACETVCEQGVCGSCVVGWQDGRPRHQDECLTDEDRQSYVALCCAGCDSDSLTLEL